MWACLVKLYLVVGEAWVRQVEERVSFIHLEAACIGMTIHNRWMEPKIDIRSYVDLTG